MFRLFFAWEKYSKWRLECVHSKSAFLAATVFASPVLRRQRTTASQKLRYLLQILPLRGTLQIQICDVVGKAEQGYFFKFYKT